MPLTLRDAVRGPRRLTEADINGALDKIVEPDDKDKRMIKALAKECGNMTVDDLTAYSMHFLETANQQSNRWNKDTDGDGHIDMNPGGVGIPADSTVQPFWIKTPEDSARILVQAIYAATEKKLHPDYPVPDTSVEWFNKIWLPKVRAKEFPGVKTVDDLDVRYVDATGEPHATWAWDGTDDGDPAYADKLVTRSQSFFPNVKAQGGTAPPAPAQGPITFGRVVHPQCLYRPITKPPGQGQDNLGKRDVWFMVLHRMIGSLWGTDGYFRQAGVNALTDYGIGTLTQDGIENDGLAIRWNDPHGYQSGWASGPVSSPYGDGKKIVDKYGYDAVNRYGCSLEISGLYYTTALSLSAKRTVAGLIAYHADQQQIPWDVFPLNPKTGISFVIWHQEFTIGTGKICPGDVVMNATDEIIGMAQQMMKAAQVNNIVLPIYHKPAMYPWMRPGNAGFGEDHWVGATEYIYLPADFEAAIDTPRYATTGPNASLAGEPVQRNTNLHSDWAMRSFGVSYRLSRNAVRIKARALWPYDAIAKGGTVVRIDEPGGEKHIVRRREVA